MGNIDDRFAFIAQPANMCVENLDICCVQSRRRLVKNENAGVCVDTVGNFNELALCDR